MTRIEELALQILIEMEKIGANNPRVEIYAHNKNKQSAAEVVRKVLSKELRVDSNPDRKVRWRIQWCEAKRNRVSFSMFFEGDANGV